MLLPQFSLRTTLAVLSACALVFLIAGQAYQGKAWAVGVTVALASVPVCLCVHALFYGLTAAVSRVIGVQKLPAKTSQGGMQFGPDEHMNPTANRSDSSEAITD